MFMIVNKNKELHLPFPKYDGRFHIHPEAYNMYVNYFETINQSSINLSSKNISISYALHILLQAIRNQFTSIY